MLLVEAFKQWLLFVESRWTKFDAVSANLQNMALEFALSTST
jgi:hypothetical protein